MKPAPAVVHGVVVRFECMLPRSTDADIPHIIDNRIFHREIADEIVSRDTAAIGRPVSFQNAVGHIDMIAVFRQTVRCYAVCAEIVRLCMNLQAFDSHIILPDID